MMPVGSSPGTLTEMVHPPLLLFTEATLHIYEFGGPILSSGLTTYMSFMKLAQFEDAFISTATSADSPAAIVTGLGLKTVCMPLILHSETGRELVDLLQSIFTNNNRISKDNDNKRIKSRKLLLFKNLVMVVPPLWLVKH